MYKLFRKAHLYFAMALTALVIMYFVSGYVLLHAGFFSSVPAQRSTHTEPLIYDKPIAPAEFASYLQDTYGHRGQMSYQQRPDGSWYFRFHNPGTTYESEIPGDGKSIRLTEIRGGKTDTLVALHRLNGYGDSLMYSLWALLLDVVSLSLVVFAASGIYMWYTTSKRRALGWLMLCTSFGLTGATFAYCLY